MNERRSLDQLEEDALEIFRAALEAVTPERLMDEAFAAGELSFLIESAQRSLVLGCGKAGCGMARRLLEYVPRVDGFVTIPHGYECGGTGRLQVKTSAHPVPDAASASAAAAALKAASGLTEDDLAIVLISGGGSSLWAGVPPGLSLESKQSTIRLLLESGAPIDEINAVRKHLSTIKGGRLAKAVFPAASISLIISDVVGDRLSVIASGPTVPDETTFGDALEVLRRHGGAAIYPEAVVHRLESGASGEIEETPKSDNRVFTKARSMLIGSNSNALQAARRAAEGLGYHVRRSPNPVTGDAAEAGRRLVQEMLATDVDGPACFLWGGETTVVVRGRGRGGRNQEVALSAALTLEGSSSPIALLSGGTDGVDGPTDAAGAIVTSRTVAGSLAEKAKRSLSNNDSYSFFDAAGGHVKTGPTGTNVMDIQIGLKLPEPSGFKT